MTMNHRDLKQARKALGLSLAQMAAMLGISPELARRMETAPGAGRARPITETAERLIAAYLAGYRPPDWPVADS